jgi:two-component system, chemotaxis family, protein-glutamate methylesterase/glutaminase
VLAGLPGDFPIPLVLLQHSAHSDGPELLAPLLQRGTELPVRTARDGHLITGPGVYVLPPPICRHAGGRLPAARTGGGDERGGGRVLIEDPRTARASSMPAHALATGCVDFALPRHRLAAAIIALALAPGGADLFTVPTPAWATLHA